MGDIDIAVKGSKRIESLLEARFGATGRGLHEKLTSVESRVPPDLVRAIRWVASVRNNVVHEEGSGLRDPAAFKARVAQIATRLEACRPVPPAEPAQVGHERRPPVARAWGGARTAFAAIGGVIAMGVISALISPRSRPVSAGDEPASTQDVGRLAATVPGKPVPGSLAALAARSTTGAAEAQRDLEENVWRHLQQNTKITVGEPQMRDNRDGTYDALVPVTWEIPAQPVVATLNKYFWGFRGDRLDSGKIDLSDHMGTKVPGVRVRKYANEKDPKVAYSNQLFRTLVAKQAKIRVFAGRNSGAVTIASGRKCFVSCGQAGDDQFQIQFSNRQQPKVVMMLGNETNPVVVKGIPSADLDGIGKLTAAVEIE